MLRRSARCSFGQVDRGETKPFDKDVSRKRLAKLKTTTYGWDTRWEDLDLPPTMTRAEAHFWLVAMTTPRHRDHSLQHLADAIASQEFDGQIDSSKVHELLAGCQRGVPEEIVLPIAHLLTPQQMYDAVLKPFGTLAQWSPRGMRQPVISGFARFVMPYLSDSEIEGLREKIRQAWDPTQVSGSNHHLFPAEFYVAACLGMHKEVLDVTSRWADNQFQAAHSYQNPQRLVFGLGSAGLVESEWRRLKLHAHTPDDARGLLACTEYACLDCLADDIIAETNKEKCEGLLEVLARIAHRFWTKEPPSVNKMQL